MKLPSLRRSRQSFHSFMTSSVSSSSTKSNQESEKAPSNSSDTSNSHASSLSIPETAEKSSPPQNAAIGTNVIDRRASSASLALKMPALLNTEGILPPPKTGQSNLSNRNSFYGSPNSSPVSSPSPLAPRVVSLADGTWVNQSVVLLYGQAGPPDKPHDGLLTVYHTNFPTAQYPVTQGHFKALIQLDSGPNRIRLEYSSSKCPSAFSSILINMLPVTSTPPLQLVILLGKDSPGTFDAPPEKMEKEGNSLELAEKKFRVAAHLWQAFTTEQMYRNKFGRRCFRLEEEWAPKSLSSKDFGRSRNVAKIHIIRSSRTVEEIRDLDRAQQNPNGQKRNQLFDFARDAINQHFGPANGQKRYFATLILDSKWDPEAGILRGHAALGAGSDEGMGIFGSHALHSFPSYLEDVVPAFMDARPTNTQFVVNDCNESGSSWEAATIGIGAFMHEIGHAFGCPHQESGVMLRDYVTLNRTFCTRESFSTRTNTAGMRLCLPKDECTWHRLDCLRFRNHPCFKLPTDPVFSDEAPQVYPEKDGFVIKASGGVSFIELHVDDKCRAHIEYLTKMERELHLTEQEIRSRLPEDCRQKPLKLEIFSSTNAQYTVHDLSSILKTGVKNKFGGHIFKSAKLGHSLLDGSTPTEVAFDLSSHGRMMKNIRVYHGLGLDGIEFFFEDDSSQLFGKRGGKPGGSDFPLEIRKGELLVGFTVRAGFWIDGLGILTNFGRRSPIYGNAAGGSSHTLIPPRGHAIAGVSGTVGAWVDGLSILYKSCN